MLDRTIILNHFTVLKQLEMYRNTCVPSQAKCSCAGTFACISDRFQRDRHLVLAIQDSIQPRSKKRSSDAKTFICFSSFCF